MIHINVSILYANTTGFIVVVGGKTCKHPIVRGNGQSEGFFAMVMNCGGYIWARTKTHFILSTNLWSGLPYLWGGHGFTICSLVPGMLSVPLALLWDHMFKIWINTPPLKCTQSQQKAHIHCGQLFNSSNGQAFLSLHTVQTKRWGPMNIYH